MLKVLIQGFLIGAAKMIPGFSGSLLAINFNVYEKTLNIIAHLKELNRKKLLYLLLLGTGIMAGIIVFSYGVKFLLKIVYFPVMLLFTGLIIGSMHEFCKEIKKYRHPILGCLLFLVSFFLMAIISLNNINYTNLEIAGFNYSVLGIMEAFTTLVPGISGTAVYMILGVYDLILDLYTNIFSLENFGNLIFYFIGIFIGFIILAKIITFLLHSYRQIMYIIILGFMTASIFILFNNILNTSFSLIDLVLGIIFLPLGYFLVIKINHLF